ncbi:UNVERIFIED_CONTAM: hypothetical protein K2H54_001669, partial [Gekko kuhli]
FEHCHCSLDQVRRLPGEFPVLPAAAEASPEVSVGLGSENTVALPQGARAIPRFLPTCPALSDRNVHRGCCRPAAFSTLTLPLPSVSPPVTSSSSTGSVDSSSSLLDLPGDPRLGALPDSAPEGSVLSASKPRRSLSPEYAVLGEEMPAATEPSFQGAPETQCGSSIQESPESICSDPASRSEEPPVGCTPREVCSSEAGTRPLRAVCCDRVPSSRPASASLDDSVAAELSHGQCGSRVSPAELPRDVQPSTHSFETEQGDGPESGLPPPGTKERASGGSNPGQEMTKMEIDESTEGTAQSEPGRLSEPGAPEQVPQGMGEAVSRGQVTPAGCSGDTGLGGEGALEGHGEILTEKPFPAAGLQETERAAAESATDNSLTDNAGPLVPERDLLDLLSANSGSRTPGSLLCGRGPDRVLPASLGAATEMDAKAPSAAAPHEAQGGHDACVADAEGSTLEEEGDVEMLPLGDTRAFAAGCPLGPRDAGSAVAPEVESGASDDASMAELSFAEAGTQTGGTEERERGPVVTEAGEERATSRVSAPLHHHDPGINTHVAKETLLQPSSVASASGFPARGVRSKGEFSREGAIAAAEPCAAMQEKASSEDLLGTCQGETPWAAAALPAGLVLGEGAVLEEPLEADLRAAATDSSGSCSEECLSQRSETSSEGDQEGVVATGRDLGQKGTRGTEPDPAAEGQLASCRLGYEEERHEENGVAPNSTCASPAASPGGKEPNSHCGRASEGQEEAGHDGASGGAELEAQRGGSVASAFPAAVGEGGLEKQPERLLGPPSVGLQGSCGSAGGALAKSPGGGVACSSAALVHGHAGGLPPLHLSSNTLEGGEEEEVEEEEDDGNFFCAGTQLLIQRSEKGAGVRLDSEIGPLLPKRDVAEEEQEASLRNGTQATSQSCSAGAKPLEDIQQPHETAEPKQSSSQVGRWTECPESRGTSSAPPTQLGRQADSPLPPDCQEPECGASEPQGPEPQGACAGNGSLPPGDLSVECSALEEACQADVAAGGSTPPRLEGCSKGVVVPEQGDTSQQSPEGSGSGEEKGKVPLDFCAAGSGKSKALQESPATSLPRLNSMLLPDSSSSDELNLRISDSEAEREENGNSRAHSVPGREPVVLKERGALIPASAERLEGAPEDSERTEQQATRGPGEAANQETGGGPSRAADELAPPTSSCYKACGDLSRTALAVSETSITATGGKFPHLVKAAEAREELEAQAVEGTELEPLNLSCVPGEDACLLESDDQGQESDDQGVEDQVPGSTSGVAEEAGSDLLEDGRQLDSRFAHQLGGETLEVVEAPEGCLQGEIPAAICAEKADYAPKTIEEAAPLHLKQEMGAWQPQGNTSPAENDPGCSMWLERPEYSRSPFPKEEESGDGSSRKRHFSQDPALGVVDSEHDSSRQKRLRPLGSGSGLPPSTGRPSAPRDLERHRDQFSRTIGRFLQQYSSQATLPSGETEEKNRDSIAQIVRSYFHSTFGPEEPEAEGLEAEVSASPLEVSGDGDCRSAAGSEAAGEETESSLTSNAEPQVTPVPCRDPSLCSECSSPSPPSFPSGPCSQQPGQELAHDAPETAWDAYFSEEEEFQSSISSVLEHSLLSSPVVSPEARCGQEPCGKSADVVFSDVSNSLTESEHCEPPPELGCGSSTGMEGGQLHRMLPEAGAVDLASGGACRTPELAGVGWCKEETSAPSSMHGSSREHTLIPEEVAPGDYLDLAGESAGAPVLQQADGPFDAAPSTEASDWIPSCASSPLGEAREERDDGTSEMQTEDGVFLQGGREDPPSHGRRFHIAELLFISSDPFPWPDSGLEFLITERILFAQIREAGGKPGIPEASENWVPESPVGCTKEEWLLDEDEAPGQLDTACLHSGDGHAPCTEAEEGGSSALAVDPEGIDHLHMEKWREQIAELQKATKPPSTYIAVVGNTGAGKSSLLNALLDEEAVLPTSAMRACTAVVVEVSRGPGGSPYQAEVEFLSQEEWYKELTALLEDMKDKSGNLKRRCPDRKTEAGAAYSRVKAVYGTVDELAKLKSMQDVTQHLGTVKRISAETASEKLAGPKLVRWAADFRANIEKFIDSRTDNLRDMKGGEFWPIVKCVKICVAQAEALKTGVVLVDLPGIRDSNAARDNAAKEYLKNCNAVWVVASITRAVDDKTAKEILNSNLRRQLFMDGLYGNLAFVCTKTDSFNISDIVRDLDLREEIQALEEELEALEGQRLQAEEEKGALHVALHLERPGVEAADPAWLQKQHDFLEKEFRLSALQKQKDAKLRAIGLICVQARNRFSKQRIRMDFNTGLEELKRKAEFSECEDDGDEDMVDGDFSGSDAGDLGEDESQREKLHVFTVSSTEYLKLSRKLLRDGPAQVFHDPKDTEIPALKDFVIETGLKTSMKATEKVIRDVARVISQIVHYLTNQRAEDVSHQAQVREMVQQALHGLPRLLQEAADDVLPDIQYFFGVLIQTSLSRGANKAKELSEDIVKSWGLPGSGFPHSTYHAACLRRGVYTSLKCGCVDFNSQLTKPVNDAIAGAWFAIFGSKMEESLERFTKAVLDKLKFFFRELKRDVGEQGSLTEALDALHLQQMEAIQARLRNFLLDQESYISKKQRSISRMLTPAIQAGMDPGYEACSQMSGPGYFQRMKDRMEHYIRENKDSIFDAAAKKLEEQLNRLQQRIRGSFQSLVLELNKSLKMQFEPLLKPVQKNAEIIPDLMNICAKVDKICKRSCVAYVLPSTSQAEASSPEAEGELQGNPLCLSALRLDVRLGALPLPCVTAIQVSGQDLALRLTDESAVALPLGRVSLCESCLPLGCLILHLPAESAGEIRRRCRVQASSP